MTNDNQENEEDDEEKPSIELYSKRLKTENVDKKCAFKPKGTILNNKVYNHEKKNGPLDNKTTHFFEELFDDYEDVKPYDLSTKPKSEDNEDNEIVASKQCEKDSNEIVQQNLMEYLSKIQQHFVSNLIQYQANILAHFQQIQQQLTSKDSKDSTDITIKAEEKEDSDDSNDHECLPQPYDASTILQNLIPLSLYSNLLSNALLSSSEPSSLNVSNLEANESSPTSLSPLSHNEESFQQLSEDQSTTTDSTLKHHLTNSLAQKNNKSSSSSQIGASNEQLSSKTQDNDFDENAEFGSSGFQYKRKRIAFSAKQYELLQTTFEHNNFPEPGDQQCIANQLSAPYRSIKMWFQNKRANARKKLMPGEKGSGRTVGGEKIPGDTDTRFYCDKCPSAFICQKYLNNHNHAHSLYTKNCPKCRVVFTHDCLLNTHLKAKCSNNKNEQQNCNKESQLQCDTSTIKVESEDEVPTTANDSEEPFPSSILSHLRSSLPLLTLLQIQRKQEEQKKLQELSSEGYASEAESNCSHSEEETTLKTEPRTSPPLTTNDSKVNSLKIPQLIPTTLVNPTILNSPKFAILRHLLTNMGVQKLESKNIDESSAVALVKKEKSSDISDDEVSVSSNNKTKLPQNIPEHLYLLLNNDKKSVQTNNSRPSQESVIEPPHMKEEDNSSATLSVTDNFPTKQKSKKRKSDSEGSDSQVITRRPKAKRLRRRTTVFTEAQHRILYLHFTHCNFPDPSMFRILSKLTGLTPHVIKIWFQNERSRQRRQVSLTENENLGTKEKKPYKCRDCGVEFAMPAFLVKHCMRHIPTDNVTSQARKCPICMVEFETQKLHSHFMASHNLSINMEEDGIHEKNICHLCQEHFPDLNSLSTHKYEHLKDTQYGDPPQCTDCKTTFVNVLCLEAHQATHHKFTWDHGCTKCQLTFYDKILLESHVMSHAIGNSHSSPLSPNATTPVEESPPSDPNNQYFMSLLKQFSDSKQKLMKPKIEVLDSKKLGVKKNGNLKSTLSHSSGKKDDSFIDQDNDSHSPSSTLLSPSKNFSFKVIPVKLIPVSAKATQGDGRKPLVTLISPQFVAINDNNDEHKPTSGSMAKESLQEKYKRVPNLIPISDAAGSFKSDDEVTSDEKKLKTGDRVSPPEIGESTSDATSYTPYASEYRKRRRTPTHFNSGQRDILEAYYKYDNFPDPNEQLHLSEYLHVPYSVIKTWFQNTRKNHRKHLKESSNADVSGPFECSKCKVCFVSKIYVDSHLKQHDETQPFNCPNCLLQFPHQAIFDIHSTMGCAAKKSKKKHDHIRQLSFVNSDDSFFPPEGFCPRTLMASNELSNTKIVSVKYDNEKEVESSDSYYECTECSTKFTSQNMLSVHLRSEHSSSLTENSNSNYVPQIIGYTCPDCDETFQSFVSIAEHKFKSNCGNEGPKTSSDNLSVEGDSAIPNEESILHETFNDKTPSSPTNLSSKNDDDSTENFPKLKNLLSSPDRPCSTKMLPTISSRRLSLSPILDLFSSFQVPNLSSSNSAKTKETILSSPSSRLQLRVKKKLNFTVANSDFLKLHYNFNNFPTSKEISIIADRLEVERERVAHWFQKQRGRERKGMAVEYQPPQQCRRCTSMFVHLKALKEHEQRVHNSVSISIQFICPFENCQAKLPNSTLLQTHQLTHQDNESVKANDLKRHGSFLEAHYLENNFPSPMDVGFIGRRLQVESLGVHWWFKERRAKHVIHIEKLQETNGSAKCKTISTTKECEACSAAFLNGQDYEKHLRIHSSDVALVCIECGADFASPLVLETHMYRHDINCNGDLLSLTKNVKSNVEIKFTFLQLQVLFNHFKHNNFPAKEELKLIGRRIKMPLKHITSWLSHQRKVIPISGQTVKSNSSCPVATKSSLDNGNVHCVNCEAEFASMQHIRSHLTLHKMGKTFACDACDAQFLHKTTVTTHSLSHFSCASLKNRAKTLDKDLKDTIKKLISDSGDVILFSTSNGGVTDYQDDLSDVEGESISNNDHVDQSISSNFPEFGPNVSKNLDQTPDLLNDKFNTSTKCLSEEDKRPVERALRPEQMDMEVLEQEEGDTFKDSSTSMLQIDQIDEDSFTEEEDDELKLVIDE